jgi:hypothetical protein
LSAGTALAVRLNVNHPFAAPSVNANGVNRRGPDLFPVMSLVKKWFTRCEGGATGSFGWDRVVSRKLLKIKDILSLTN